VAELALESPLEWALFDALTAEGFHFDVRAGEVRAVTPEHVRGHARFIIGEATVVSYAGKNGFEVLGVGCFATVEKTLAHLRGRSGTSPRNWDVKIGPIRTGREA
jgi:hypothetical protein